MYVSLVTVAAAQPRSQTALTISGAIIAASVVGFALADHSPLTDPLTAVLCVVSVASVLIAADYTADSKFAPSFICAMLAVAFLGPAGTFVVLVVGEIGAWLIDRYRWRALIVNLAGIPGTAAARRLRVRGDRARRGQRRVLRRAGAGGHRRDRGQRRARRRPDGHARRAAAS